MKFHFYKILLLFLLYSLYSEAQLIYPIEGRYKKQSAQGMAIWGHQAFLFSDKARCRVLNLNSGIIEREFLMRSADSLNHANNACFGIETVKGHNIPVIYISECRQKSRCFVECINDSNSTLIQTIELRNKAGKRIHVINWVVDKTNGFMYAITRNSKNLKSIGIVHNYISKYNLPKLEDGDLVTIKEDDVLEKFEVQFPNILQGAKIHDGLLYIVTGLQQSLSKRKDSGRAIQVIDLLKKKLIRSIDLTYVTTNEPEDMDFYKDKALLYTGQEGGIYQINIK